MNKTKKIGEDLHLINKHYKNEEKAAYRIHQYLNTGELRFIKDYWTRVYLRRAGYPVRITTEQIIGKDPWRPEIHDHYDIPKDNELRAASNWLMEDANYLKQIKNDVLNAIGTPFEYDEEDNKYYLCFYLGGYKFHLPSTEDEIKNKSQNIKRTSNSFKHAKDREGYIECEEDGLTAAIRRLEHVLHKEENKNVE